MKSFASSQPAGTRSDLYTYEAQKWRQPVQENAALQIAKGQVAQAFMRTMLIVEIDPVLGSVQKRSQYWIRGAHERMKILLSYTQDILLSSVH
jgi:hypothetical protein